MDFWKGKTELESNVQFAEIHEGEIGGEIWSHANGKSSGPGFAGHDSKVSLDSKR